MTPTPLKGQAISPALWQILPKVVAVMGAIRNGRSHTQALLGAEQSLRPAVQALSFHALRHWGRAQCLRDRLITRKTKPVLDDWLSVSLALLQTQAGDQAPPYPAHTLVDQTITALRADHRLQGSAGFINACLRRYLREENALQASVLAEPLACWNLPTWWIEQLRADHPTHWQHIALAGQVAAPMVLRINTALIAVDEWLRQLAKTGRTAHQTGPVAVQMAQPCQVSELPGFAKGWVSVQDAAAQLAAPLLLDGMPAQHNLRLLDACAAPGGKTGHLKTLCPTASLIALEKDPVRMEKVRDNLQRMGLSAELVCADAVQWAQAQVRAGAAETFDGVLLDAPCTGSGIVRRHPDVPWLRRPSDVGQLAVEQSRLLAALWPLVKPGGRLLYCTCSVFRQEGALQLQAFLKHRTDARQLPSPGHLLPDNEALGVTPTSSNRFSHDGFYYGLLEKVH
jgi:16S rRNA (cytosine967-C5)-methyltransferase